MSDKSVHCTVDEFRMTDGDSVCQPTNFGVAMALINCSINSYQYTVLSQFPKRSAYSRVGRKEVKVFIALGVPDVGTHTLLETAMNGPYQIFANSSVIGDVHRKGVVIVTAKRVSVTGFYQIG